MKRKNFVRDPINNNSKGTIVILNMKKHNINLNLKYLFLRAEYSRGRRKWGNYNHNTVLCSLV